MPVLISSPHHSRHPENGFSKVLRKDDVLTQHYTVFTNRKTSTLIFTAVTA